MASVAAQDALNQGAARKRGGGVAAVMLSTPAVDPLVPLSLRVPQSLRRRLRIACLQRDRSVQDVVAEALETWLKSDAAKR